jgi:hypothetical protein
VTILKRKILLRSTRDASGSRNLWAKINAEGDLVIEGQDLGSGVSEFWGPGNTEYEWDWTIRKESLPKLVAELGGGEDGDVLSLLAARFFGDAAAEIESFLKAHEIPFEFWSRVGD